MATRLAEIAAPKFLTWARPVIAPTGPSRGTRHHDEMECGMQLRSMPPIPKRQSEGTRTAQGAKPDSRSLLSISNAVRPWVAGSLAMGRWRGEEAH
jgi:hypothetical protein